MSSWTSGPMNEVTCVSGESFVVSDISGDVLPGGDHGFSVRDTRVLSGLLLRVDGEPLLALHAGVTGPGRATFHGFVRLARSLRKLNTNCRPFAPLPPAERAKVRFIHLNHSNPLLDPASEASARVRAAGHRVARQGERVPL